MAWVTFQRLQIHEIVENATCPLLVHSYTIFLLLLGWWNMMIHTEIQLWITRIIELGKKYLPSWLRNQLRLFASAQDCLEDILVNFCKNINHYSPSYLPPQVRVIIIIDDYHYSIVPASQRIPYYPDHIFKRLNTSPLCTLQWKIPPWTKKEMVSVRLNVPSAPQSAWTSAP